MESLVISSSSNSQHQLAAVESFGVAAGSIAFHPAQPHEGKKRVLLKPGFGILGLEGIHDVTDLLLAHFRLERHEHARLSQVTVVFRNLVFQNQMVPKCIPGQFRDQTMVLVRVLAVVSEDEVRGYCFQVLENCLHFGTHKWHETVRESLQQWSLQIAGIDKHGGSAFGLDLPDSNGAENHPVKHRAWVLFRQPQNRATTTNFYIVGMGAQA